ncbi:MAG: hypothetical protein H7178_03810 [Chitinophagaceae bacterium]|nr:hypothetical protein [Chitinophagaceae bacterium]
MIVQQTDTEIIIKLPKKLYSKRLQVILDYLEFKTIVSKSKASQKDVDSILSAMKITRKKKVQQMLKA